MRNLIKRGIVQFSYTPLLGVGAAVSFLKLFVYAHVIGVTEFGALGQMLLVSAVFGIAGSFGLQSIVSRDLPYLIAKGRTRRGYWLLAQSNAVMTWAAIAPVAVTITGFVLFDLSKRELLLGVLHGWAHMLFFTLAYESRSRLDMWRYARQIAGRNALIALAGSGAGLAGLGADGVVSAEVLGTLFYFLRTGQTALRLASLSWFWFARAHRLRLRVLPWKPSLLVWAAGLVIFASINMDRWIAAETLGRDSYGAYAFAWISLVAAQSLQGLLNSGLMPLLSVQRARQREASARRITIVLSVGILVAGLVAVPPVTWAITFIVSNAMSQYAATESLWLPLLLAAVLRVSDFWSSLLLVQGREGRLLTVQTLAVVCGGIGYATYLHARGLTPEPASLAWLAFCVGAASHLASAITVLSDCRRAQHR